MLALVRGYHGAKPAVEGSRRRGLLRSLMMWRRQRVSKKRDIFRLVKAGGLCRGRNGLHKDI